MTFPGPYAPVHDQKLDNDECPSHERPWRPRKVSQLPWTGLLSLILGFGCAIAALTISLMSQGKPLGYWTVRGHTIQPTVILALLTTLTNALLGYAYASGIAMYWWTTALRGSTLRRLHASHSRGTSLLAIFNLRPIFNIVTGASILTVILLMDQPLFQRGLRVVTQPHKEIRTVKIPISSSPLQQGATVIPTWSIRPVLFHPLFSEVVRQYQNRDPIRVDLPECTEQCDTTIVAPGWDVKCIDWQTSYHLMDDWEYRLYDQYGYNHTSVPYEGPPRTQQTFSVSTWYAGIDDTNTNDMCSYQIRTAVMYKSTAGANGTMNRRNCTLSEAVIRHPIEIKDGTLRLKQMGPETNRTVYKVLRLAEPSGSSGHPPTVGGVWTVIDSQFRANASLFWNGLGSDVVTEDIVSNTYLRTPVTPQMDNYNVTWADPTDDIVAMAQELTLRAAIATTDKIVVTYNNIYDLQMPDLLTQGQSEVTSPNLTSVNRTLDQEAEVTLSLSRTVYEAQPGWLAGAFFVITLAWISIIPMYWGWWHLRRAVSMSPLEIAKAFDAPLMENASQNGTVDDHLRAVGGVRVRYGFHASHDHALAPEHQHIAIETQESLDHTNHVSDSDTSTVLSIEQQGVSDIELQILHSSIDVTPERHSGVDVFGSGELPSPVDPQTVQTHLHESGNEEAAVLARLAAVKASVKVLRFEAE